MTNAFQTLPGAFTLRRTYKASPARVFRAWSDPDELAKWAAPAGDWKFHTESHDFRVGGCEISRFGSKDQMFLSESRFDDIVPDKRIVMAFRISQGSQTISSSVMSIEFLESGMGTELVLTEAALFLDGHETPDMRKQGTTNQLDQLEHYLNQET